MALSRMAAALLLAFAPAPAAAAQTAEQAMARYREVIQPTAELDCPKGKEGEDIVVCGRRPGNPLPLPIERGPGEVVRHINEQRSGESMVSGCIYSCPPAFGVTDKMVKKFVEGVGRLLSGD